MQIFDISMMIEPSMAVYNNLEEKRPELKVMHDYSNGAFYESRLHLDMHTGTHIDAPLHMQKGGDTIENFDLRKAVYKCKVFDFTNVVDKITKADLTSKVINAGDYILLKTANSYTEDFKDNFIFLEYSGAEYLKGLGIIGVGIDGLGIERSQPGHETHLTLLNNGITILEGLRLKDISEGEYTLIAAPLKIKGSEASPVRALLIKE